MENITSPEESLDSIPRPEYERLDGGGSSGAPTPTETQDGDEGVVDVGEKSDSGSSTSTSSDSSMTDDSSSNANSPIEQTASATAVAPWCEGVGAEKQNTGKPFLTLQHSNKNNGPLEDQTSGIPTNETAMNKAFPIKIVNTANGPKLVPAKLTNKLVMVHMVDGNCKRVTAGHTKVTLATTQSPLPLVAVPVPTQVAAPVPVPTQVVAPMPVPKQLVAPVRVLPHLPAPVPVPPHLPAPEPVPPHLPAPLPILAVPVPLTVPLQTPIAEAAAPPVNFKDEEQPRPKSPPSIVAATTRSTTPISREFIALQRSVNESKVLTEFVTVTGMTKERTLRNNAVSERQSRRLANAADNNRKHEQMRRAQSEGRALIANANSASASSKRKTSLPLGGEKVVVRNRGKEAVTKNKDEGASRSAFAKLRCRSVGRKSLGAELTPQPSLQFSSVPKNPKRRNMRSQNSEFAKKKLDFRKNVSQEPPDTASDLDDDAAEDNSTICDDDDASVFGPASFRRGAASMYNRRTRRASRAPGRTSVDDIAASNKRVELRLSMSWQPPPKPGWDSYCWKCRVCGDLVGCAKCLRSYHRVCVRIAANIRLDECWTCPECLSIENILNGLKRTQRRNDLPNELLCQLLSFAVKRMEIARAASEHTKYSSEDLLLNSKFIVNPITYAILLEKIERRSFRCTDEFVAETKWMLHNALILTNAASSKETRTAKAVVKLARQEANEIETCSECYLNANTRTDWFVEVCSHPHLLIWAKLKGFPYWPAKAMGLGQSAHVNVRFFGDHDRAYVPLKDCYLYSEQDPNSQTAKRQARELADCIKEVELHVEKIRSRIGNFKYAPYKTPYDPAAESVQLERMIPGVGEYMRRQQTMLPKPSLQYKIVKTAGNHLSIIKKADAHESGNDSDHSTNANQTQAVQVTPPPVPEAAQQLPAPVAHTHSKPATPKYEVISKASTSAETGDCAKVSAVILKRKSVGVELRKSDDHEPLTAKIKRVETAPLEWTASSAPPSSAAKRKHGQAATVESPERAERHKTKQGRLEQPPIPVLTIKANGKKATSAKGGMHVATIVPPKEPHVTKVASPKAPLVTKVASPKAPHVTQVASPKAPHVTQVASPTELQTNAIAANEAHVSTQEEVAQSPEHSIVESLVKSKQGITIRKVHKQSAKKADDGSDESSAKSEPGSPAPPAPGAAPIEERSSGREGSGATSVASVDSSASSPSQGGASSSSQGGASATSQGRASATSQGGASSTSKGSATAQLNKDQTKKTQSTYNYFKDLVPFVEVKEEIISDDERSMPAETLPAAATVIAATAPSPATVITATAPSPATVIAATAPSPATVPAPADPPARPTTNAPRSIAAIAAAAGLIPPAFTPILIKEEIESDDGDEGGLVIDSSPQSAGEQSAASNAPANGEEAVRVVGDTTIQRIATRHFGGTAGTATPPSVASTPSPTEAASCVMVTQMPSGKRSILRGVPYGPLPASVATPTTSPSVEMPLPAAVDVAPSDQPNETAEQTPHMHYLRPNPRARKTFPNPNRSTPEIAARAPAAPAAIPLASPSPPPASTTAASTTAASTSGVSISAISAADPKRSCALKTTSMVSIPVDVTTLRAHINTIPMPPLTAVSKVTPTTVSLTTSAAGSGSAASTAATTTSSSAMPLPSGGSYSHAKLAHPPIYSIITPPPLAGLSQTPTSVQAAVHVASSTAASIAVPPTTTTPTPAAAGSFNNSAITSLTSATTPAPATVAESHLMGETVTPTMASAITELICRGPPKMLARPAGPLQSDGSGLFPSQAGPVSRQLFENGHKLADFFISVMEDTMSEMATSDTPTLQARITLLQLELERARQLHELQTADLKRSSDILLCEMRKCMEKEKARVVAETRRQCEAERVHAVNETKKKQWCANCGRESQFYCCWNTSYCDYPCQQLHWSRHSGHCAQTRASNFMASIHAGTPTLNKTSLTTTTNGSSERQMAGKSTLYSSNNNNNTVMNNNSNSKSGGGGGGNKKDKNSMKNQQQLHQQTPQPAASAAEMLKLPPTTYLRAVSSNVSGGSVVANGANASHRAAPYAPLSMPMPMHHHFNIPLPIASPLAPGPNYTIVQRGNNWELQTTLNQPMANNNINAINSQQQQAQQPQQSQLQQQLQQQQQSSINNANGSLIAAPQTRSGKGGSRQRLAAKPTTSTPPMSMSQMRSPANQL